MGPKEVAEERTATRSEARAVKVLVVLFWRFGHAIVLIALPVIG